jgi:hypothetical protein
MECLRCKKPSGKSTYCRACRKIRDNALATVSQNKKKLIKLLLLKHISDDRFIKFYLYVERIKNNGLIYLQFKQEQTNNAFNKIVNGCTLAVCFISLRFAFEIYLVS